MFFILLAFGLLLFLIFPSLNVLEATKQEVKLKAKELQNKQLNRDFIFSSLEEAKNYQLAIDNLNSALPKEFFAPDLFGFFQEMAQKSGLIFDNITEKQNQASGMEPNEPTQLIEVIKEYNFVLQVKGSVENFIAFLKKIETSGRFVEISGFSFLNKETMSQAQAQEASLTEFSVEAKVYHY